MPLCWLQVEGPRALELQALSVRKYLDAMCASRTPDTMANCDNHHPHMFSLLLPAPYTVSFERSLPITAEVLACRCVYFWAATSLLMSVVTFSLFVLMGHDLTAEVGLHRKAHAMISVLHPQKRSSQQGGMLYMPERHVTGFALPMAA